MGARLERSREILVVVGARPNFVKVAPLWHALQATGAVELALLHTGQHYDHALAGAFIEHLKLPPPDVVLDVGSGTHAEQTAAALVGVERVLLDSRPAAVVVAGDVNSTLAAALAAVKVGTPIVHIESGLRSLDWAMPEEVNRVLTDRLSSLLLCTSADAVANLASEGIASERVALVGNTMIDSLYTLIDVARARGTIARLGLSPGGYALVTLHRPALVDDPERLGATLRALADVADRLPVVFPLHPRTRKRIAEAGLAATLEPLLALDTVDYLDFVALEESARLVITDSGGVQEETSAIGVPCLTFRETTERPVTIELGTNQLVGVDPVALRAACLAVLAAPFPAQRPAIPLWDGQAGPRAAAAVLTLLDADVEIAAP